MERRQRTSNRFVTRYEKGAIHGDVAVRPQEWMIGPLGKRDDSKEIEPAGVELYIRSSSASSGVDPWNLSIFSLPLGMNVPFLDWPGLARRLPPPQSIMISQAPLLL